MDILIVEDDEIQRKVMYDLIKRTGHDVKACDSLSEARIRLKEGQFKLIFLDRRLPDGDSFHFLEEINDISKGAYVVFVTGHSDVKSAIQAIRDGAYDYLPKPYENEQLEKIIRNVENAVNMEERVEGLSRLSTGAGGDIWQLDDMIGGGALRDLFTKVQRIASFPDTTVLLLGESGTGKGMMASAVHRLSTRSEKPFVDINCSAIPGPLMESEVFGYEKGAFTDAKTSKPGLLEIADGGTVFLDEIGDMAPALQAKLLKVIEDKQFRRLGGSRIIQVDVRIIAATCRNLQEMVKDGSFREDLYYRLSVFPLTLPPLREHPESIPMIADQCLKQHMKATGSRITGFTTAAMEALCAYQWPGNVRELRHSIERGVILCSGTEIDAKDLSIPDTRTNVPANQPPSAPQLTDMPAMSLAKCERQLIMRALHEANGHRGKAAEILEIHRTSLLRKIKEHGITS
jgi:DNA-binding NtrC family response regulator